MLTECRFRYYVPVNVICSLPEFRFAQYVRKSALPTIRFLILKNILFSLFGCDFRLKHGHNLTFSKDRKRIKISELVEYIVDLVFVGQVCPTDQPKLHKRTKMGNLKIVGWKMFYVGSFKIILRTFPPLNFWWE